MKAIRLAMTGRTHAAVALAAPATTRPATTVETRPATTRPATTSPAPATTRPATTPAATNRNDRSTPTMFIRGTKLILVGLALTLAVAASASARPNSTHSSIAPPAVAAQTAPPADDAVVLPSRVAAAIRRTEAALANAEKHIDEAEYTKAIVSLRAVRASLGRTDRAARHQMNAVPADPEAETTPGPDSVIAALNVDQEAIVTVAGLFNGNSGALVTALASTITSAQLIRDRLLNAVIALDPEGAGAPYADGMPDTLDGYSDEVANLTEAVADDKLSTGGAAALRTALGRSNATLAKFNTAFGGGE